MKIILALAACAMLLGCTPNPEEAEREKIAQMEAIRREISADMFRQKADCQAFAIEFPNDLKGSADCLRILAQMQDLTAINMAVIDRRIAEVGGR